LILATIAFYRNYGGAPFAIRSGFFPLRLVRIKSVRSEFFILAAVALAGSPLAAQDTSLVETLPQIARQASRFWQGASGYFCHETLHQKALILPKRKLRIGRKATEALKPEFKDREIVSYYALSAFRTSPEALHEFRQVVSVDGKPAMPESKALQKFQAILKSKDDRARTELQEDFDQANLAVAATDFGQLILLFTKANLGKYSFERDTPALIGADRAIVIKFRQSTGREGLRIEEPGKQVKQPLSGQLWVRESDYQPLRITLTAARQIDSEEIRDEARVDYAPTNGGAVLPASVIYRRYVDNELKVENVSQYSDWQPVNAK
jgi:hypothetical protein